MKTPRLLHSVRTLVMGLTFALVLGSATIALADAPAIPAGTGTASVAPQAGTTATAGAQAVQQPSTWGMMMPLLIMFAVVYFMMIRPQQKKLKEHQRLLESVKSGDEVVTASGILGRIAGINDRVVTLEVASNVHVKMLKSQISQVVKGQVKELA